MQNLCKYQISSVCLFCAILACSKVETWDYYFVIQMNPWITTSYFWWYLGTIQELVLAVDFRCDDEKKILSWGDILVSLRSWRLQDSKNAGH